MQENFYAKKFRQEGYMQEKLRQVGVYAEKFRHEGYTQEKLRQVGVYAGKISDIFIYIIQLL